MSEKPHVLIIDDDAEVRKSLQIWLKGEGFKVFTAGDRNQAREIIRDEEIAVSLVDLRLKSQDGLHLSAELRELDEFLKIIIITGYPTYESAIDAMKTGVFDYISKSTPNDAILAKIHAAVEARGRELMRRKGGDGGWAGIVLIGHHLMVREGLENYFGESSEYRLLRTYHALDYIKKSDFNLDTALVLICASCNHAFLENPEKTFANIKIVFPNAKSIIINCIQAGQIWISRELSHRMLNELLEDTNPEIVYKKPVDTFNLTGREVEILKALASGLSNFAISEKLFLSEKTIKTHTHHIFRKMEVKTRTQAVIKGMEFHII
jgi:DNA-binding NarL/FixJ family response regulator